MRLQRWCWLQGWVWLKTWAVGQKQKKDSWPKLSRRLSKTISLTCKNLPENLFPFMLKLYALKLYDIYYMWNKYAISNSQGEDRKCVSGCGGKEDVKDKQVLGLHLRENNMPSSIAVFFLLRQHLREMWCQLLPTWIRCDRTLHTPGVMKLQR